MSASLFVTWVSAHSHDLCIWLCSGCSAVVVLLNWGAYRYSLVRACSQPIHVWLLVTCALVLLFRAIHRLAKGPAPDQWDGSGCYSLFTAGRKLHAVLIAAILYPCFLGWTFLGSAWYSSVQADTGCFESLLQLWLFSTWLIICLLWILVYTSAIVVSALVYCSQVDSYQDLYERLPDLEGLSCSRYPCRTLANSLDTCSICLEEMQVGQLVRTLGCSHTFHQPCLDPWLLHHRNCPLCKQTEPESSPLLWQLLSF